MPLLHGFKTERSPRNTAASPIKEQRCEPNNTLPLVTNGTQGPAAETRNLGILYEDCLGQPLRGTSSSDTGRACGGLDLAWWCCPSRELQPSALQEIFLTGKLLQDKVSRGDHNSLDERSGF